MALMAILGGSAVDCQQTLTNYLVFLVCVFWEQSVYLGHNRSFEGVVNQNHRMPMSCSPGCH